MKQVHFLPHLPETQLQSMANKNPIELLLLLSYLSFGISPFIIEAVRPVPQCETGPFESYQIS